MEKFVSLFESLADPTRLQLLALLRGGELCVCHLQTALQTTQPKISRHLACLRRSGLVQTRREGKWIYYELSAQARRNKVIAAIFRDKAFRSAAGRKGKPC